MLEGWPAGGFEALHLGHTRVKCSMVDLTREPPSVLFRVYLIYIKNTQQQEIKEILSVNHNVYRVCHE